MYTLGRSSLTFEDEGTSNFDISENANAPAISVAPEQVEHMTENWLTEDGTSSRPSSISCPSARESSTFGTLTVADGLPSEPTVHMKLSDFLEFLRQCDTTEIELRMKGSHLGSSVLCIDINGGSRIGLNGRLEVSPGLSVALRQYMLS